MLILGIESTCDETAAAVVRDGREILSNCVTSQFDLHEQFGGVVPELACRRHIDMLLPVIQGALDTAGVTLDQIDAIAVANGPGLVGAIFIGLNGAKGLAIATGKPFIGVNHVEAHLYAAMMSANESDFSNHLPALGVVLSGGHTAIVKITRLGEYEMIGQTIDDAIGEAFDKVAKMLDLPYPGGPKIEQMAKLGDPTYFPFSPGRVKNNPLNFSFSGLKTAVLYAAKGNGAGQKDPVKLSPEERNHLAASFQKTAFQDIVNKIKKGAELCGAKSLVFGGGVTNNQTLRKIISETFSSTSISVFWPGLQLSLDNAAMIAGLGYWKLKERPEGDQLDLEAAKRIPLAKGPIS
jgi:N6-L-threonylcarbamoyladenine synthase